MTTTSSGRPLRIAHRGDWRRAPENSLAALDAAMAIPACDGVEFDVRVSADGVPVLLHDALLRRVQGVPGGAREYTAEILHELEIPTLAEALEALPRRAFINVDLKGDPGPTIVNVLAAGRGPDLHNGIVSSFYTDALDRVAALAPSWPRWLNSWKLHPDAIGAAIQLGCVGISADWRDIDPTSVARVRAAGLGLAAWAVRRRSTYARLTALGVDIIIAEFAALDG
jgi:glycerophosphoryl diester phosphodiesterase